ncbi:3-carboxy-cis,cis-muconate cycloisomerase [Advenella sp. S44]|nr:3-carboxy-cis,cis-muconate cycloisomerase [Advenella sp. S44]PJX20099.1 3-carboxy-cis,cis-muconate cycloisomerase [Advenella sp. S44]
MKKKLLTLTIVAECILLPIAQAEDYPSKPITWIVPFAAGGPTDSLARMMADRISRELGQSIVIENTPGAGGTIGATRAARAKPDGYTMLVGHFGYMAAAPSLYANLRYDPVKNFNGVFRFPDTPMVLLVNGQSPYNSLQDFLSSARAEPGRLNVAHAGVGSASHLTAALFAQKAGIDIQGVPYRGGGQALTDVMGGQADAIFDQANTVMALVGSDKIRPLAQTSPTRSKQFPDLPTVAEAGIPGFEAQTWYGLYAPSGTPQSAIRRSFKAYQNALADPAFQESLFKQGLQSLPDQEYPGEALEKHTRSEIEKWNSVIRKAGIQPQS